MTECKRISIPKPKICASDLNKRVTIYERPIEAPVYGSATVQYDFIPVAEVWAAVETIQGDFFGDMVSRDNQPTDRFYIRYRDDITSDNWIGFNGFRFDILRVENINRYKEYLILLSVDTGSSLKAASQV